MLSRTEKRENKIDMITERLKEELHVLGGFLDNISTRRPEGKIEGTNLCQCLDLLHTELAV